MIGSKFSDRATHGKIADFRRDIFSDLRDSAFDSIGIDKSTRDYLQPVVDKSASLLSPGGAVPYIPGTPTSYPQATGYSFNANIDFKMIGIGIGVLVLGYLIVKKG